MANFYKITFAELKISPPTFPFFIECENKNDLESVIKDYLEQGAWTDLDYQANEINRLEYEDETRKAWVSKQYVRNSR